MTTMRPHRVIERISFQCSGAGLALRANGNTERANGGPKGTDVNWSRDWSIGWYSPQAGDHRSTAALVFVFLPDPRSARAKGR
jgi:hypothetical protein